MGIQRQSKFEAGEAGQHCIHYIVNAFRRKSSRDNTHTGQLIDGLSRLLSPADLGLDISLQYNASDDITLLQLLQLCDPDAAIDTIAEHIHVLTSCQQLLGA